MNERIATAEQQTCAVLSQYEALAADQEQILARRLQDQARSPSRARGDQGPRSFLAGRRGAGERVLGPKSNAWRSRCCWVAGRSMPRSCANSAQGRNGVLEPMDLPGGVNPAVMGEHQDGTLSAGQTKRARKFPAAILEHPSERLLDFAVEAAFKSRCANASGGPQPAVWSRHSSSRRETGDKQK
jgi:hypothetical protein